MISKREERRKQFLSDGFVRFESVVDKDWISSLRDAVDHLLEDKIEVSEDVDSVSDFTYRKDEKTGKFLVRRVVKIWKYGGALYKLLGHPEVVSIACGLAGEPCFPTIQQTLIVKVPSEDSVHFWHRDPGARPSQHAARFDFVCGVYLDTSNEENGCLWVVPKSHKSHLRSDEKFLKASVTAKSGAIPVSAKVGDVLVHNRAILHSSGANRARSLRRTIYIQFRPVSSFVVESKDFNVLEKWAEFFCRAVEEALEARTGEYPEELQWVSRLREQGLSDWLKYEPN